MDRLQDGKTYNYKGGAFSEAQIPAPVIVSNDVAEILYFELGKTTLDERELARLEFYAQNTFKKTQKLLISGCADAGTGTREVNERLSWQRAEYVKGILVNKFGYNPANITTQADVIPSTSPIKGRIVTIEVK
jgi:outer membrane protein OmpA-like peptidoglycan-associated protein